jgi:hypothetical protein
MAETEFEEFDRQPRRTAIALRVFGAEAAHAALARPTDDGSRFWS